jgi:hypothetical protein
MNFLNKELYEPSGQKLELASQPDGSLGITCKKIWSDEEIENKKKEDSEAVASGIGRGLLSGSSEEARVLVAFLTEVYETNTGQKAESASAIGRAWLACFAVKNEKPESDLALRFEKLNDAHQATGAPAKLKLVYLIGSSESVETPTVSLNRGRHLFVRPRHAGPKTLPLIEEWIA